MKRLLFAVTLLSFAASAAAAQVRGAFVMTMGADTVALERFERDGDRLSGVTLFKLANLRTDWTLESAPDGSARRMRLEARYANTPLEAKPLQEGSLEFRGDSVVAVLAGRQQAFAMAPGAVPYLNPSIVMFEQMLRRARAVGGEQASVEVFVVSGGQSVSAQVRAAGADTVAILMGGSEVRLAVSATGEITGGGIPAQRIVYHRVESLPVGALVAAKPDYSAPPESAYVAEQVRVRTREGFELAGTLTKPKGAKGRLPAVVTISGSGSQDRDGAIPFVRGYRPFREIAEALAARGVATLRLDDRGFGESGGDVARASSLDFARDVEAAVAFLRARPDVDAARVALVGHSEGGLIAPIVASRDPKLRAIVLLAGPAYTGRRVIEYQQRQALRRAGYTGARLDSACAVSIAATDSSARTNAWLGFFLDHDPLATASTVRTPVLVLQGATDRQVTEDQAPLLGDAFRAAGNRDVSVRVVAGTNHLLLADPEGWGEGYAALPDKHLRREVLDAISDWLAPRLGAKR